ncbi:MAG: DUF1080 domain-containing protein [Verrucomicrobia bacterium]|nr:DUF1080 domain-containing protein [Verrucomicrobiota bacterium]
MNTRFPFLGLVSCFALAAGTAFAAADGFKSIFNGKDLSGWDGNRDFWSVRDGALTGQTTAEKVLKSNTFLVWQGGTPANFELRAQFRLTAQNEKNQANSGVQYRSRVTDPATFVVGGYQADIDSTGKYTGMLYEERGRGILMTPGQKIRIAPPEAAAPASADAKKAKGKAKAKVDVLATATKPEDILAAYKLGEWNEIRIVANGNHLQHFVNGKLTADVTDTDEAAGARSGVIALQLHQGPPMTIQFKEVRLKTLP